MGERPAAGFNFCSTEFWPGHSFANNGRDVCFIYLGFVDEYWIKLHPLEPALWPTQLVVAVAITIGGLAEIAELNATLGAQTQTSFCLGKVGSANGGLRTTRQRLAKMQTWMKTVEKASPTDAPATNDEPAAIADADLIPVQKQNSFYRESDEPV